MSFSCGHYYCYINACLFIACLPDLLWIHPEFILNLLDLLVDLVGDGQEQSVHRQERLCSFKDVFGGAIFKSTEAVVSVFGAFEQGLDFDEPLLSLTPTDSGIEITASDNEALAELTVNGYPLEVSGSGLTRDAQTVQVPVTQLVRVGFGSGCYLSREGLETFFRVRYQPNSLLLCAETGQFTHLKEQVNRLRGIALAVESARMLHYSEIMMDTTVLMLNLLAVFSLVAGVIMIYNIINISMRERRNEFGTLMVLGMRRGEITEIIAFEQIINFVVGIALGYPFSILNCRLIEYAVATDTLSVAMRIRPVTYLGTFAVCAAATALSVFFVIRGVLNIQLTEVLKARD